MESPFVKMNAQNYCPLSSLLQLSCKLLFSVVLMTAVKSRVILEIYPIYEKPAGDGLHWLMVFQLTGKTFDCCQFVFSIQIKHANAKRQTVYMVMDKNELVAVFRVIPLASKLRAAGKKRWGFDSLHTLILSSWKVFICYVPSYMIISLGQGLEYMSCLARSINHSNCSYCCEAWVSNNLIT